jgi:hypothetical protein
MTQSEGIDLQAARHQFLFGDPGTFGRVMEGREEVNLIRLRLVDDTARGMAIAHIGAVKIIHVFARLPEVDSGDLITLATEKTREVNAVLPAAAHYKRSRQ